METVSWKNYRSIVGKEDNQITYEQVPEEIKKLLEKNNIKGTYTRINKIADTLYNFTLKKRAISFKCEGYFIGIPSDSDNEITFSVSKS